jgi:hypothetical protein
VINRTLGRNLSLDREHPIAPAATAIMNKRSNARVTRAGVIVESRPTGEISSPKEFADIVD